MGEEDDRSREPDRLRALLEELHEELAKAQNVDEATRAILQQLMSETRVAMEGTAGGDSPGRYQALDEGLRGALERFEGTHPTLAYVMGRVIDTLSGLGI